MHVRYYAGVVRGTVSPVTHKYLVILIFKLFAMNIFYFPQSWDRMIQLLIEIRLLQSDSGKIRELSKKNTDNRYKSR